MRNGLKKELALLCGVGSLVMARRKSPVATALAATGLGLYVSSLLKRKEIRGRSVLITGGSRGLGMALAQELLRQGARVSILARKGEELDRARTLLLSQFPQADLHLVAADVTDQTSLRTAIFDVVERWQGLDILINNAGAITVGPFATMNRADFEAQMELHFFAIVESTFAILPVFRQQGHGHIVNICSLGGKVAVPHMLPYDSSKFALAGFSQGLAAELAAENIQVTTVYPAVMRTGSPIQAVFKGQHEKEFAWFAAADVFPGLSMSPTKAAQKIIAAIQDEKAELIPFLPGKIRVAAAAFLPEIVANGMKLIASLMPSAQGGSDVRRTGAQIRRFFDQSKWLRPLKDRERQAEIMYNQNPSENAEFNMGIW
jgi:short-subunit dehydrogenase